LENNIDIDNLIGKYLSGEATPDEAIYLEEWKATSSENSKYFEDYERLYHVSVSALSDTKVKIAWKDVHAQLNFENPTNVAKPKYTYWAIAASIIFVMGLAALYFYFSKPVEPLDYIALNETRSIKLKDNSEVDLYKNSNLQMNNGFDASNRTLKLKGSAYFKVVHNEAKPFIVSIGTLNVKDIGTKFKIVTSENGDTVTINVDEGIILVYDSLGFEREVGIGQRIVYVLSQHQLLEVGFTNSILLKSFQFKNTSLKEVISQVSAAYNVPIVIESEKIFNCSITTQFKNESLENVLLIITETLGIEARKTDSGFVIIGDQCKK
jgi:transmembrane sensor